MSWVLLKDESRGEDNSPCVNNATTWLDITPENDKKHVLTRQMVLHRVAMLPCLLETRVQTDSNRPVIVQRQPLNQVQAGRNHILPQLHMALQITCRLYQLIPFPSVAFSPFSPTKEVIQRQQLQLRHSEQQRGGQGKHGWM